MAGGCQESVMFWRQGKRCEGKRGAPPGFFRECVEVAGGTGVRAKFKNTDVCKGLKTGEIENARNANDALWKSEEGRVHGRF